jgi:predicted alpha/beta superfamily hydrolase
MTKDIRLHADFASEHLGNSRTLSVYLPPGYAVEERRYPVFYLQDGQNLFDPATAFGGVPWRADVTADELIRTNTIEPLIIVGIGNTDKRLDEYGPKAVRRRSPGKDFPYARFVVDEVKPFIDRTYRTKPDRRYTAIGGSSMGALVSLFLAHWHPLVFGHCAALSPSLWWDKDLIIRDFRDRPKGLRKVRFWIDTGTREGMTPRGCREQVRKARLLAALLGAAGLHRGRDFKYREYPGGEHNEHAWAARFGEVLTFLFKRKPLAA